MNSETLYHFGRGNRLSIIVTKADNHQAQVNPVLLILNAGIIHKAGPNRLNTQLARQAASNGFTAVRMDFSGIGDTRSRPDVPDLRESISEDVSEAIDFLEAASLGDRVIVVGLCSGADNALRVARQDPRVIGVAMLDPSVVRTRKWYLMRIWLRVRSKSFWRSVLNLSHPRIVAITRKVSGRTSPADTATWGSPVAPELFATGYREMSEFEEHLSDVVDRQMQLFVAFSGGWSEIYNYHHQFYDLFPRISFGRLLTLKHYPFSDHTFSRQEHRRLLFDDIVEWVNRTSKSSPTRPANTCRS